MAKKVQFGKNYSPQGGGKGDGKKSSDLYMKLSPGKHTVRFIGDSVEFHAIWADGKKYLVPDDLVNTLRDCEGMKGRVRTLYASNVIDRADQKAIGRTRFKILEKGSQVFDFLNTYATAMAETNNGVPVHPGNSKTGPNWLISVEVPSSGDKRQTEYKLQSLNPAPLTDEEKSVVTRPKTLSKEELEKLPLGERGLIKLDTFYDTDKNRKEIIAMIEQYGGTVSTENSDKIDDLLEDASVDSDKGAEAPQSLGGADVDKMLDDNIPF